MTPQPLVSVVVPFYNTAAYLAEAIESVLAQSYRAFELVLVNNRSTDGSDAIAARYAGDARVRVVHNEQFLSQVQNYNHALRQISPDSRYCKMVQADDAILPRCLEEMVALAEAHPSIGVVGSYRLWGSQVMPAFIPRLRSAPEQPTVMSGHEAARLVLADDVSLLGTPTALLLRADLVRGRVPFYAEGRYFEDVDAILELLAGCDFGFVPQILTFQRPDMGSTWGRMRTYYPSELARLLQLHMYGPLHLSPAEQARAVDAHERHYRRLLAVAWLRRREPAFWEYHRKGLALIGRDIHGHELLRESASMLAERALSPVNLLAQLARSRLTKPAAPS